MGYIVSCVLFLLGLYISRKRRTWSSPGSLFCYEWAFISLLASLQLFGMYSASIKTWIIILVGSVAFLLGVNFGSKTKIRINEAENFDFQLANDSQNSRLFWILFFIVFAFAIKDMVQSVRLMMSGVTLDSIRLMSYGIVESSNYQLKTGLVAELITTFISAIETIIVAIGIQKAMLNPKKDFKCLAAVTVLVLMRSFSDGGRFGIAYLIVELLVCSAIYRSHGYTFSFEIPQKIKKRIGWIVLALVGVIIALSLLRGAETSELIKKCYRYICGNIVFFDLHVQELDQSGFWSYGYAGLYGIWAWVLPLLHNSIGIPYPETYLNTITNVMNGQLYMKIGENMYTNAFITPFYQLYADFRWIGVFGGMFIFGIIAGRAYKKSITLRKQDIVYYLVIAQMMFKTLQVYPLASKDYVMVFVVLMLISVMKKVRIGEYQF